MAIKRKKVDEDEADDEPVKRQKSSAEQPHPLREYRRQRRARLMKRTDAEIKLIQNERYPNGVKECNMCHEQKALHLFSKAKSRVTGVADECRACGILRSKPRRDKAGARTDAELRHDFNLIHPTGLKVCSHCNEGKGFTDFYMDRKRQDGRGHICKQCSQLKHQRIAGQIKTIKTTARENKTCENCSCQDPRVFDFAHKSRATKRHNVSHAQTVRMVTEEIPKTKILCANCHRKETVDENKLLKKAPELLSDNPDAIISRKALRKKYALVNNLKINIGSCKDCGLKVDPEYPSVHDFDHLPGYVKLGNISIMCAQRLSDQRILAEIAKCQLLCVNCHRITTANRILAKPNQSAPVQSNALI